jgi:hypothetical protein
VNIHFIQYIDAKSLPSSERFLMANWDLGEVERDWKDKIIEQNGLVNKLYIPK